MIELLEYKTITNSGHYRNLSSSELARICTIYFNECKRSQLSKRLRYRGVTDEYLNRRLKRDSNNISESEMLKRLFYFGDKSRHYFQSNDALNRSGYLKNIEDLSPSSNYIIFKKFKGLIKSKNARIKDFVEKNTEFFDYFSNASNKDVFSKTLIEYGLELRDYYLAILHAAGNIGLGDKSTLISTSADIDVASEFSQGERSYIILYFGREKKNVKSLKSLHRNSAFVPFLAGRFSPFPEQQEITYQAGLYPHNMLGVLQVNDKKFIVNPHIFSRENEQVDITKESLYINQANFAEQLSLLTFYTRWNKTFNHNEFYHGGEVF